MGERTKRGAVDELRRVNVEAGTLYSRAFDLIRGQIENGVVFDEIRLITAMRLKRTLSAIGGYLDVIAEGIERDGSRVPPQITVNGSGTGGGVLMKVAMGAIEAVFLKVVGDTAAGAFEISTFSVPCGKAAVAVGVISVIAGIVLQEKKPGLSKSMVKFVAVVISFVTLIPLGAPLSPAAAGVYGVVADSVVVVTAALC